MASVTLIYAFEATERPIFKMKNESLFAHTNQVNVIKVAITNKLCCEKLLVCLE